MKKKAVIFGGALAIAAAAAGVVLVNKTSNEVKAIYWDGKADINAKGADGRLPLFKAVGAKDLAGAEYLLNNGVDIKALNDEGKSLLEAAFESGSAQMVELLAAKGAVDFRDVKYLSAAISGGNLALVKKVLDNGGKVNAILEFKGKRRPDEEVNYMDARAVTPLKAAVLRGNAEVVELLLERGAEGASYFFTQELLKGNVKVLKVLAKYTGGVRNLAIKGMDVLNYAANEASPEVLAFLLEENAGNANTAFLRLLSGRDKDNSYQEAVEMFLASGAQPGAETLELALNKRQTELFYKLAECAAELSKMRLANGEGLLMYTIEKGFNDEAGFLLDKGFDIWAKDANGETPVWAAVKRGKENSGLLALMVKKAQGENGVGYDGESLLMLLAKAGNYDEFKKAADGGADLWQKDKAGRNVLMYAAEGGEVRIADYLLYKGDNLGARDSNGKTALMYAAESGVDAMFNSLFKKGARGDDADDNGKTVLMYAAENGRTAIAEKLISSGESALAADKNEKTVLMYAAQGGSLETTKALLDKGVAVDLSDRDGVSALSYAAQGGNVEIAKLLRARGANVYAADKNGRYALTYALLNGDAEMFRAVSYNEFAGFKEQLPDGTTPAMQAVLGKNNDLIRLSIDKLRGILNRKDRNGQTFLMLLAGDGRADFVRDALRYGADPQARDNNGKSVLMYAAEGKSGVNLMSVLQKILGEDAVNIRDKQGRTALMYAVSGANAQAVKQHILLMRGAKTETVDDEKKTALMYAVSNEEAYVDRKAVEELLAYGRNVEAKDKNGKTALMYAAGNPKLSVSVLEALLNAGADVRAVDNSGKSVLMYAAESGDISKFKLLKERGAPVGGEDLSGNGVAAYAGRGGKCFGASVEKLL